MGEAMVSIAHIGASLPRFLPEAKYVNNTGFQKMFTSRVTNIFYEHFLSLKIVTLVPFLG